MIATTTRGRDEALLQGGPAARELVERLHQLVERNGARWKKLMLLEAVGLVLSAPLAYLLLFFLLDNLFHLPILGRLLANLVFVGGVTWLIVGIVRRWRLVHLTEDRVALAMERRTPGGVQNRLINAVQIARDGRGTDPAYRQALVEENYERLQQIGLQQAARFKPAFIRLGVAGLLILIGLCFWIFQPDYFSNAAARFLLPFADIDPLYRTRLLVEPGNVEAVGEVTLRVTIQGERPDKLTILRNVDGKRTSEIVPVERGARVVTYVLRDIEQSLDYAVQGGDFTSPYYHIEVPRTTSVSLVRVTYQYPAYTRLPAKTTESAGGDLEALQGTRAQATFVLDQAVDEAALLLERVGTSGKTKGGAFQKQRLELERQSATEYRGTIIFQDVVGYRLELRQGKREAQLSSHHALRVLIDQDPKLDLSGLEQRGEVQLDSVLPLKIAATDDYGLKEVGLFVRRAVSDDTKSDEAAGWKPVKVWKVQGKTALRQSYELAVTALNVSEGDKLELALRGVDTDPLKKGRWTTGTIFGLLVGGEGVALQIQYEQIVRTEAELKKVIRVQQRVLGEVADWIGKLDGKGNLRWEDAKNITALHAAVTKQGKAQEQVQRTASRVARDMVRQAGNLRISVGMLADSEMIRAIRILDSVATRDQPQGKRATLAEARTTQQRTIRSLQEILDQYASFRSDWELAHMIPFTKMLADRQAKLGEQSRRHAEQPASNSAAHQRTSAQRRQLKILNLCRLIQPAFKGLAERLQEPEPTLSTAFQAAAVTLASDGLQGPIVQAAEAAKAGEWKLATQKQGVAAKELANLHARLRQAQLEAARKALAALQEKAKSDLEAQKELERLKAGNKDLFVKDFPSKLKIDEIIRIRGYADRKQMNNDEEGKMADKSMFAELDLNKLELKEDSGVRQDPNTLQLGDSRPKTFKLPNGTDTKNNKVKPFIQEEFADLVGKLLEEADELGKDYQSLNLSTNQNNNDPGEIGKQAGRLNSTGAVAATGNKKPPTSNHGGISRTGRQGARAHGMVAGDEGVNRRGRDKPLEGQERVGDQAGKHKMQKSDDMQKETSTGIGGKKIDSDDTHFSISDAGKWTDDIAKRMDKPQKKNSIVERQGGKLDPRVAAMLRDLNSKQEQVIERLKTIKKELKNLYLPTDHLDDLMKNLKQNLERLKQRPDADLFRLQVRTLDRLRNAVRVFRTANAGFEPSVPRQQVIRGRVLDEPSPQTIPGYEEAVKRYYQKLASK